MIITFNYILLLMLALLIMHLPHMSYRQKSRCFLVITGILLFSLYCVYDWNSLPDLPHYAKGYEHVRYAGYDILFGTGMRANEPGWIWLNVVLSNMWANPRLLFIVAGFLIIFGHFKTYSRYSAMPWLSAYLFFCSMFCQSLFVLRQHMAIGICLLTLPYIFQRRLKPFLLMVVVAGLIHSSAWIFLLSYWIYPLNVGRKFMALCIIMEMLSWLFMKIVMNKIIEVSVYSSYLDMDGANIIPFLISLCTVILTLVAVPLRKIQEQPRNRLFFCLCCVAMCIAWGGMGISVTGRLNMYFTVFSFLMLPNAIQQLQKRIRPYVIICVMVAYALLLFPDNTLEQLRMDVNFGF